MMPQSTDSKLDKSSYLAIDASFVDEMRRQPTLDLWYDHEFELLLLIRRDDPAAIDAGLRVLPCLVRTDLVLEPNRSVLAIEVYDHITLTDLERLSVEEQVSVIWLFDKVKPLDWGDIQQKVGDGYKFLETHPKTKLAFDKLHGAKHPSPSPSAQ